MNEFLRVKLARSVFLLLGVFAFVAGLTVATGMTSGGVAFGVEGMIFGSLCIIMGLWPGDKLFKP